MVLYPLVNTTHVDSICSTVLAPADVNNDVMHSATKVARAAIASLDGAGVFGASAVAISAVSGVLVALI